MTLTCLTLAHDRWLQDKLAQVTYLAVNLCFERNSNRAIASQRGLNIACIQEMMILASKMKTMPCSKCSTLTIIQNAQRRTSLHNTCRRAPFVSWPLLPPHPASLGPRATA